MNKNYTLAFMSGLLVMTMATVSCAQGPKVKTITIVNGDTTITESNLDEKEMAKLEKEIEVIITDDGKSEGTKKIVKKVIITDDKHEGDAMAYAYAFGEDGNDVEVITNENGTETKVIVKNGEGKGSKDKNIIKKEIKCEGPAKEKVTLNLNISINKTTAKVQIESSSTEPMNISVLDENGKQVFYDSQKTGGKYTKDIPLGKKGTYFLNFIQNKTSKMETIIVE